MESTGKLKPGGVLRKVRLGLRGRGASLPRQGSERVDVQGKVKLRVGEANHETDSQRKWGHQTSVGWSEVMERRVKSEVAVGSEGSQGAPGQ